MAGPYPATDPNAPAISEFGPNVPPMPEGLTPDQKDQWWLQNVYQGDRMPQLTLRAVLMGGILGMLMSAANLYTTLAIGWAFGVAITACVMSFVAWNLLTFVSHHIVARAISLGLWAIVAVLMAINVPPAFGWGITAGLLAAVTGLEVLVWFRLRPMSILENNCMQSTASAAGYSTGSTLATMFGALLLLAVVPEGKTAADVRNVDVQPIWVVVAFTLCTGLMGVFLAVPLKRQMINHEGLRFPSGIASAETLRSLYSQSKDAMLKAYVLIAGIATGALVGILNTGEGTLKFLDRVTPSFLRLPELVPHNGLMQLHGKGFPAFGFEPSVLLIAAGVITRMRVSLSMFVGALILHFAVAPALINMDQRAPGSGWSQDGGGAWVYDARTRDKDYVTNMPLNVNAEANRQAVAADPAKFADNPQRPTQYTGTVYRVQVWALWGGTAVMVFASLTAVGLQWRTVSRAFVRSKAGSSKGGTNDGVEVPTWWMFAGMVPIAIAMLAVQIVAFNIAWWAGCIAIGLSFFLSLVACRATGETDTTPIGAMGKVMQLTFAIFHPGQIVPNLASAGIAANSASSAADLLTDLKSGYLLGANPRKQFIAQFCGVFFGTLAIVPVWFLMVPNKEALEKFAAPATRQWEAVARVLTKGVDQLPQSAQLAALIGAFIGVGLPLIERALPASKRKYLPSAMGLGLSWVIPFGSALGFMIGAVIGWIWELTHKRSADRFSVGAASGLIAGESLIKAIIAMSATVVGLMAAKQP